MNLLITIPYHAGDADLLINQLKWIYELDRQRKNKCLLITDPKSLSADDGWPDNRVEEIGGLARKCFKTVTQIYTPYRRRRLDGTASWPLGANWAFYLLCLHVAMTERKPFMFLEPDAVPLKEKWLEELEEEYKTCGKPFMGPVLSTNMPSANPTYMNGAVSIYPADAMRYMDSPFIDYLNGGGHAFDVSSASRVVPEAHPTRKSQHFWGSDKNTSPTFKLKKEEGDAWNVFELGHLMPEAVVYHRVKDGSLINLLRIQREESKLLLA